jgi:hypothetical protein
MRQATLLVVVALLSGPDLRGQDQPQPPAPAAAAVQRLRPSTARKRRADA